MGKSKNSKSKSKSTTVETNEPVVAENFGKLSDAEALALSERGANIAAEMADDDDDDDGPKARAKERDMSWVGRQLARVKRAESRNMIAARLIRANHDAAQMSETEAELLAVDIEHSTKHATQLITSFLNLLPEAYEGLIPGKSGITREGKTSKAIPVGSHVKLSDKIAPMFDYFSADDLASLTVHSISKGYATVVTANNEKVVVPAKQIELVPAAA